MSTPSVDHVSQSKLSISIAFQKNNSRSKNLQLYLNILLYLYQNVDTKLTETVQTLEVEVTVMYTVGKARVHAVKLLAQQ